MLRFKTIIVFEGGVVMALQESKFSHYCDVLGGLRNGTMWLCSPIIGPCICKIVNACKVLVPLRVTFDLVMI